MLTVKKIESVINLPVDEWPGKCYEISCKIVEKKLVDGVAVYGHWLGSIANKSQFNDMRKVGFCHHGWIKKRDGKIVDATRWVFEAIKPYVYKGSGDGLYDEGGNKLRKTMCGYCPKLEKKDKLVILKLPVNALKMVKNLTGSNITEDTIILGIKQIFWLANLPYDMLMPFTPCIFCTIDKVIPAFVPIDNLKMAKMDSSKKERMDEG